MKAAAEAGDRASRADSRTPPSLVLGASLLLPFVGTGGFGGDALVLGAVGAWRGWQFVLWTAWWAALAGAFSVRDSGPLLALFTQALRSRIPRRWKWQSPPSQLAYPPRSTYRTTPPRRDGWYDS
jgi:prepilin signal peptidase PulO-like enzyme (type II secretory pathway)